MRYQTAISLCLVLSACGTSQTPPPDGQIVDRVRIIDTNDPYEITHTPAGPSSSNAILEFPAKRVWPLVPSAYSVLSIPVTGLDSVNQVVSGRVVGRRSFAGRPFESLVDCGSSLMGPNAATYSITMKLTTHVTAAAPEASRVRTLVDASGTSTSGSTMRCSSTGELELAILSRLQQGLSQ